MKVSPLVSQLRKGEGVRVGVNGVERNVRGNGRGCFVELG